MDVRQRKPLMYLLLDPSWFRKDIGSAEHGIPNILSEADALILEGYGRKFCHQIYRRRWQIIAENETEYDTETEDDDDYSLHDTSENSCTSENNTTDSDSY